MKPMNYLSVITVTLGTLIGSLSHADDLLVGNRRFAVISRGETRTLINMGLALQPAPGTTPSCSTARAFFYIGSSAIDAATLKKASDEIVKRDSVRAENVIQDTEYQLAAQPALLCKPGASCFRSGSSDLAKNGIASSSRWIYGAQIQGFEVQNRDTLCDLVSGKATFEFKDTVAITIQGFQRIGFHEQLGREILDKVSVGISSEYTPIENAAVIGSRLNNELQNAIGETKPETVRILLKTGFSEQGLPRSVSDRESQIKIHFEDTVSLSGIWSATYTPGAQQ